MVAFMLVTIGDVRSKFIFVTVIVLINYLPMHIFPIKLCSV